jgi:hypothetical protein
MFNEPGVLHTLLLVLVVGALYALRKRLPGTRLGRIKEQPESLMERRRRGQLVALECTELVLAGVFLIVGGAKLIGQHDMVELFRSIGVGQWLRYVTGMFEVVGAAFMIVPLASGASAVALGTVMISATLVELFVLRRPPIAAMACLSAHTYVAWSRLLHRSVTAPAQDAWAPSASSPAKSSVGGTVAELSNSCRSLCSILRRQMAPTWFTVVTHLNVRRSISMLNERERFARRVFLIAAVYGILVLAPQYFAESRLGLQLSGAITRPEHFYGFIGVALTWQFVFLAIASDVRRFRPLMLIGVTEKLSFGLAAAALYAAGRIDTRVFAVGAIDLSLGALFFVAFLAIRPRIVRLQSARIVAYPDSP